MDICITSLYTILCFYQLINVTEINLLSSVTLICIAYLFKETCSAPIVTQPVFISYILVDSLGISFFTQIYQFNLLIFIF